MKRQLAYDIVENLEERYAVKKNVKIPKPNSGITGKEAGTCTIHTTTTTSPTAYDDHIQEIVQDSFWCYKCKCKNERKNKYENDLITCIDCQRSYRRCCIREMISNDVEEFELWICPSCRGVKVIDNDEHEEKYSTKTSLKKQVNQAKKESSQEGNSYYLPGEYITCYYLLFTFSLLIFVHIQPFLPFLTNY